MIYIILTCRAINRAHRPGPRHRALAPAVMLVALALAGCSPGAPSTGACGAALLPGDLVITEIMANPDGTDADREWFEIYNATTAELDLAGVELVASRADGTGEHTHRMAGLSIRAGGHAVVGNADPDAVPAHVDYSYDSSLGGLLNSAGRVAVRCDVIEVDSVTYEHTSDGKARALQMNLAPDYMVNDAPESWCDAQTEFAPGNLGTPGATNDCAGALGGRCDDGGTIREINPLTMGDVVITELMPNPAAVGDADGEWFEMLVTRDVDLNGLTVGRDPTADPDPVFEDEPRCLPVSAGSHVVFARSTDPAINGGLPGADFELPFSLVNSNGTLHVGTADGILDRVTWARSTAGVSTSLDASSLSVESNGDPAAWCDGVAPYGLGDLGSPGAENPSCGRPIDGMCDDGGVLRPIVSPGPGQATITEIMANPAAVSDTSGEWFEIRFDADVDLNGLQLGRDVGTVSTTMTALECLRVTAGTYAVWARSSDPAMNGGLPPVAGASGFGLVNSGGRLFVGVDDQVLDVVTYGNTAAGASTSLDETDGVTFCPNKTDVYGAGDTGTPGASNPVCP